MMNKVTAKLGLIEGANEDLIAEAVKKIQDKNESLERKVATAEEDAKKQIADITNKANADVAKANASVIAITSEKDKAIAEGDTVKAELTTVKDSLTAKEKELKEVKDKYDAMEKEKNDAVTAEKKTKAEALVASHVKTGRVKNESKGIAKLVNLAIEDFEGTKELIESFPLSAKAPVITELDDAIKNTDGLGTSSMSLAVRNKLKREGRVVQQ